MSGNVAPIKFEVGREYTARTATGEKIRVKVIDRREHWITIVGYGYTEKNISIDRTASENIEQGGTFDNWLYIQADWTV